MSITGSKSVEKLHIKPYATMSKIEEEVDDVHAEEVAIIGYWKLDERKEFTCYHHFEVPNPQKRLVRMSAEKTKGEALFKIYEVLYTS